MIQIKNKCNKKCKQQHYVPSHWFKDIHGKIRHGGMALYRRFQASLVKTKSKLKFFKGLSLARWNVLNTELCAPFPEKPLTPTLG